MTAKGAMRCFLGVALVISAAGPADAQPDDAGATADQLFEDGRELARADRWAEACPKFEASLRMDPALGSRLNLAACYEHIGELARAWRLYRESADLAEEAGDVKRRDYARAHAAALEPRLAGLAIPAPVATEPAIAPRSLASADPVTDPPSTRTHVAIGLGAAGLATAGAGLLFGAKARSSFHEARQLCGARLACPITDYDRGKQLVRDARSDATLSTVLVAAGGAAIVAGAVVFLTRSSARDQRTTRLAPIAHDHGAGVALVGRF
jgi:tetratricopeptide (TPR) repeat protein